MVVEKIEKFFEYDKKKSLFVKQGFDCIVLLWIAITDKKLKGTC